VLIRLQLPADFLDALRCFVRDGGMTEEVEQGGLRYFVNSFWTSGQRQAHSLHEISYRACFKPQLPDFFITRLTAPGETVYDPFSGRGTTALQTAIGHGWRRRHWRRWRRGWRGCAWVRGVRTTPTRC
jgi:hypothetical protein